jgi:hypothetical protein
MRRPDPSIFAVNTMRIEALGKIISRYPEPMIHDDDLDVFPLLEEEVSFCLPFGTEDGYHLSQR